VAQQREEDRLPLLRALIIGTALIIAAPAVARSGEITDAPPRTRTSGHAQIGKASLYGNLHGRRTASGERYDSNRLTAAHRSLPLNTRVRVTNLENGRSVTVKVNDRGPVRRDRVIDLSRSAAEQLGMRHQGLARVRVEPLPDGTVDAK
jgi:rare lipoprotein A